MASTKAPRDAAPPKFDDLDNYFLEGDLDDDPFASPRASNKRKGPGDLNVDEEVSVAKKARVPRIKLDQDRLLSQKGIPALRKRAKGLKLKGKGHEWGDASRLLSFYQDWLDDLFPKAKFIDALAMVEKAGHNKQLHKIRAEWIHEGRPKTAFMDEGGDAEATEQTGDSTSKQAERIAPIFEKASTGRQKTPELDDLFGDEEDIYNATPIGGRKTGSTAVGTGDEPDEDELDALMAMEETIGPSESMRPRGSAVMSIFGDGRPKATPQTQSQPDEFDELDALIAEADYEPSRQQQSPTTGKAPGQPVNVADPGNGDDDDLDAFMAEAEAHSGPAKPAEAPTSASKTAEPAFDDDEEAMAEMDGLW